MWAAGLGPSKAISQLPGDPPALYTNPSTAASPQCDPPAAPPPGAAAPVQNTEVPPQPQGSSLSSSCWPGLKTQLPSPSVTLLSSSCLTLSTEHRIALGATCSWPALLDHTGSAPLRAPVHTRACSQLLTPLPGLS